MRAQVTSIGQNKHAKLLLEDRDLLVASLQSSAVSMIHADAGCSLLCLTNTDVVTYVSTYFGRQIDNIFCCASDSLTELPWVCPANGERLRDRLPCR